jgi:hypothetical protein
MFSTRQISQGISPFSTSTYDEDGRRTTQRVSHAPMAGFFAEYDSIGRLVRYQAGNVGEDVTVAQPVQAAGSDSWS